MADVTITIANIEESVSTVTQKVLCGEAGTGGQALYLKSTDSKFWLASDASEEESVIAGYLLTPKVQADGYATMVLPVGLFVIGGTVAAGTVYYTSSTAGAITDTEPASTKWVHAAGVGASTTEISLGVVSRVQHV